MTTNNEKIQRVMFNIFEKDMNTGKSKFFVKVSSRKEAESRVREMNADSLFEDKFYFFKEENSKDE